MLTSEVSLTLKWDEAFEEASLLKEMQESSWTLFDLGGGQSSVFFCTVS